MAGGLAKIEAWVKGHKPEAAGVGVAAVGGAYLLIKKHSGGSASSASGDSSSTGTATVPAAVTVDNPGTAETDRLQAQDTTLKDDYSDLNKSVKGLDKTVAKDKTADASAPAKVSPIPAGTKHSSIVAVAPSPDGGNWDLGSDGGIFSEGGAKFYGSYPGLPKDKKKGSGKFVSLIPLSTGGYAEIDSDGDVFTFSPTAKASK